MKTPEPKKGCPKCKGLGMLVGVRDGLASGTICDCVVVDGAAEGAWCPRCSDTARIELDGRWLRCKCRLLPDRIALYDRAARHLTLADVKVDAPWRGNGICSKIVERLFKLAGEKYQPRSFAIDVRPQRGSDTGPRACACYMNALRRAWDGHISRMRIEFESGETLSDAQAEAAACREGNLFMEGELTWR